MELPFGGFLLEQRVGDFLGMQTSLLLQKPVCGIQDSWELGREPFLCPGSIDEDQWRTEQGGSSIHPRVQTPLEAESSSKGVDFGWMFLRRRLMTCVSRRNVPRRTDRVW